MNILQLSLVCAPNWSHGGPPRIMADYANGLAKMGHRVTIYTPRENKPLEEEQWSGFEGGVTVNYFEKYNDWRSSFYFDFSYKEIYQYLMDNINNIDAIHLPQTRSLLNVIALRFSREFNIPIILHSFGSLPSRTGFVKSLYDKLFVFPMVKSAALLLGQTNNELSVYRQFGGKEEAIRLLPLAVDKFGIPKLESVNTVRQEFCQRFNIEPDHKLFLFLGRLHPTKGVPLLVESFISATKSDEKCTLIIVGNDEGVESNVRSIIVKNGVDKKVRLCGPLYADDRWAAYQAADVYVISPNIFEETPLAAVEALSASTPVITNLKAELPWLDEYKAGIVMKTDTQGELHTAITQFVEMSEDELMNYGNAAYNLFSDKYELTAVCEQLDSYLSSIVTPDVK
ncbi:glycosyltransferase [Vibrio splendidus]